MSGCRFYSSLCFFLSVRLWWTGAAADGRNFKRNENGIREKKRHRIFLSFGFEKMTRSWIPSDRISNADSPRHTEIGCRPSTVDQSTAADENGVFNDGERMNFRRRFLI